MNWVFIGSANGLSLACHKDIDRNKYILSIGLLRINFSVVLINIYIIFLKMHLKMSPKCQQFWSGLNGVDVDAVPIILFMTVVVIFHSRPCHASFYLWQFGLFFCPVIHVKLIIKFGDTGARKFITNLQVVNSGEYSVLPWHANTETKMSSFWGNFHNWLHQKMSFWQLLKILSIWHFNFSVHIYN